MMIGVISMDMPAGYDAPLPFLPVELTADGPATTVVHCDSHICTT